MRLLIAIGLPRQQEAGAAGVVLNHAKELRKRGHEVTTWFLEDVIVKPVKRKRFEAFVFASRLAARILSGDEKFDVVNLHAPWGCVYGLRRKFAGSGGAPPYVMTMQGSERRYVEAMSLENDKRRAANFAWKNKLWHRVYHQTMYDVSVRTADYGAIACEDGVKDAERTRRDGAGCMRFVPNGTEEKFFLSREFGEKMPLRLLFVGTWLDRKGVYYLAESFLAIAPKFPGIRLTVAGCLADAAAVKKHFADEVRERVDVVPFVKREDMPALYARHDIFVFPSLVEGMPLTLLEAMATGMPVATTRTCGMADVVEDQVNGLLVPPADSRRLTDAIVKLCESAELRKRLGDRARQTMKEYTWDGVTAKLEAVLVAALNGSAHAAHLGAEATNG